MKSKSNAWKQLCWSCKYACDRDECIWVKTLKKHYEGTKIDSDGYIIECPHYEKDGFCYNNKDRAEKLGISLSKYNMVKGMIAQRNLNMSVGAYLEYQKRRREEIQERKKLFKSNNEYFCIRRLLEKKGISMSPEEYMLERKKKKLLRQKIIKLYGKSKYNSLMSLYRRKNSKEPFDVFCKKYIDIGDTNESR